MGVTPVHAVSLPKEGPAGASRVIVGLRLPWRAEGLATPAERGEQRLAIAAAQSRLANALSGTGAEIVHSYETIPFQALSVTPAALAFLLTSDLVSSIEPDRLWRPTLAESVPLIQADRAWALGVTGTGMAVAIVDTGVETTHPFLSGRVVAEACYSMYQPRVSSSLCPNTQNAQFGPGAADPSTCAGIEGCDHGTHVAGIAAGSGDSFSGVAKGASVIAVKVFTKVAPAYCGGDPCIAAYTSDVLKGLEYVFGLSGAYRIAAVNMSLGGALFDSESECDKANASAKAVIDNLRSVGIATVIASGNDGSTSGVSEPACISTAVAVGSITKEGAVSSFSNSSPMVDLLAPGSSINSSVTGGGFGVKSGTSMAAPHVAGAWAILKQLIPTASVTQVLSALSQTGYPLLDVRNGLYKPQIFVKPALDVLLGPPPSISIQSPSIVTEGNAGATPAVFNVTLSRSYLLPASVDYATDIGTATAGEDYVVSQGTLVYPPGTTARTIGVPVLGDYLSEGSESFNLVLSDPVNATLGNSVATAGIADDDGYGFSISDVAVTEPRSGAANAVFTVTVSAPVIEVTVDFHTTDGSAAAPDDYVATAGTLTFVVGQTSQTILVPVKANGISDSGKTFHVDLENSSVGPIPIVRARGTATISEPGFYAVAPCRVLDTRTGPQGPALFAGSTRTLVVSRACGVPMGATAASLNVTVVSPTAPGDLRIFPAGVGPPLVSAINYGAGQTRANNVTMQLGPTGLISVLSEQATGTVDLIVDVNGYFE